MNHSQKARGHFRRELNLLCGVSAISVLAATSIGVTSAWSQSAPSDPDTVQSVVVTGMRASIQSSILAKKTSDEIIESIVAEDIGKLPDLSIAESLARLPGVAAQRVDGRAQEISIRGMGPKYGVTLLNGNEMVSTGDDRSFQYDQFPAELVNRVTVYKTPDVALGTQGLSGTVDIGTLKPLDYNHRIVTLNARGETNSFGANVSGAETVGNRLSGSYVDQFANGTIGVALGLAHLDSPTKHRYFDPWDYGTAGNLGLTTAAKDANTYGFDGFEVGAQSTKSVRDGFLGAFEYKPNEKFHSVLNLFHSQFSEEMQGPELNGGFPQWNSAPNPTISFSGSGAEVATGFYPIVTMRGDDRKDKVDALDFDNHYIAGPWDLRVDVAYSRATRREAVAESYISTINPINMNVQWGDSSSFSQISSAFNFGDPANYELSTAWGAPAGGYITNTYIHDEMKSVHISGKRELRWGPVSSIEAGVLYSDRTKSLVDNEFAYNLNGTPGCVMGTCAAIPASILSSDVNLGFAGIGNIVNINPFTAMSNATLYTKSTSPSQDPFFNWSVDEKIINGFIKADLEFTAIIPIHGNIGAQVINSKVSSQSAYIDTNGVVQPLSGGQEYTDFLPALNLIGDLGDSTQARFSVARMDSRPDLSLLRASMTASVATGSGGNLWNGDRGNPNLAPWRSTDIDFSLSRYFGKASYVSIGVFDKEISSAIYTLSESFNFTGYNYQQAAPPASPIGTVTEPINTKGGWVRGVELSFAFDLKQLHPALDGFGINGSASNTGSNLPGNSTEGAPTQTHLDGLSENVDDLGIYYEKNGFEARIGERYRSDFTAVRHNAFKYVVDDIRGEALTDIQVGYSFQQGNLKGLSLLFQIENLFNTPYVTTQAETDQNGVKVGLKEFHEYGAQYLLGATFKF